MELSRESNYKAILKARAKELQKLRPPLTWKRIAEKIPIQYTYLSKALNDPGTHLNEDALFHVGQLLGFYSHEIEYLVLLRAIDTCGLPARKEFLRQKLEKAKSSLDVSAKRVSSSGTASKPLENAVLLEPYSIVVAVALTLPRVRQDPRMLCGALGISLERLKEILRKLSLAEMIELTAPTQVARVHQPNLHFGKEHPLMRIHQFLLKSVCQTQLMKNDEDRRDSLQVTFTADEATFRAIQEDFRSFLKQAETKVKRAKDEKVFQMSFDLFEWL